MLSAQLKCAKKCTNVTLIEQRKLNRFYFIVTISFLLYYTTKLIVVCRQKQPSHCGVNICLFENAAVLKS